MDKAYMLAELIRREAIHYPSFMCQMQSLNKWRDLYNYCEGKPFVELLGEDGYLIYTKKEVVDFASSSPRGALKGLLIMRKAFRGKTLSADFRESTSYPILLAAERKGQVTVKKRSVWYWGDEIMVEVKFKVQSQ